MNKREILFSENTEVRVTLKLECFDKELHATLKFRESKPPILEIDPLSGASFRSVKLSESEKEVITCESQTYRYSLLENEVMADDIWPRYVVQGEVDDCLSGIEVLISGVSEWIDQQTNFDITETEIRKDRPKTAFDELIEIDSKRYQISSNYNCSVEKKENNDFLVSESTSINIISLDETITAHRAESLAHEVRIFFSLLLAVPLSIECVWLVNKEGRDRKPFYFSLPGNNSSPFQYPLECLINPVLISKGIGWKKLFKNYASSSNRAVFKNIWGRLASLFSYTGTWDYELLGYVSVLDSYCNKYASKKGKKLNKESYEKLKGDLFSVITNLAKELGDEYSEVMSSFRDGIDGIRNTNLPTFREKYDFMMQGVDVDIRRVVNFTSDEFVTIKKIRDSAAHGLPIKTRDGRDISYEFRVKNKLLVLLMYLVYRDFGMSPVEFALSLKSTLSKFVRNADINKVERDRIVGTVPFWEVGEGDFKDAKTFENMYVGIKHIKSDNTYKFSKSITRECQSWLTQRGPKNKNLVDHLKEGFFETNDIEIEYVSQAYLVNGSETIELSGVCKVSYEL